MMRRNAVSIWLGFALLLLMLPSEAASQHRTALVVGNTTYEREPMRTPVNDATDMAMTLEQLGFVVSLLHNASRQAMEEALVVFGEQLRDGAPERGPLHDLAVTFASALFGNLRSQHGQRLLEAVVRT